MDIRQAAPQDAGSLANLVFQLGYSGTPEEIVRRLAPLSASASDAVFTAVEAGSVVGFIHVRVVRLLEADAFAEIAALVVSDAQRGRGVGHSLVEAAETWAREQRMDRIRVRSNVIRERAKKFYEREGYAVTKVTNVFDKPLA